MGITCYYSLEKILSTLLLSKKVKVNTYKIIILRVVLCGCETWTLNLREQQRLRMFENKVLRRISGAINTILPENEEICIMLAYMHSILLPT